MAAQGKRMTDDWKSAILAAGGWLAFAGLPGCQCSPLFNGYARAVDHVQDHRPAFDAFYRPQWDLNRIGKADWRSRANDWWCPDCGRAEPWPGDPCLRAYPFPERHPFFFPGNALQMTSGRKTLTPVPDSALPPSPVLTPAPLPAFPVPLAPLPENPAPPSNK